MTKRPIDIRRDSAFSLTIGDPDDRSPITDVIDIGGHLHFIKENSIFRVLLADDIDPNRTNVAVPNTVQKVSSIGSNSIIVGRTLLTAQALFDKKFLGDDFDVQKAVSLVLESFRDFSAMYDLYRDLLEAENEIEKSHDSNVRNKGSFAIPSIPALSAISKSFIQKTDHTSRYLLEISRLFYKNKYRKIGFNDLMKLSIREYGRDDPFSMFLIQATDFLNLLRNLRNSMEHPRDGQEILFNNFLLDSEMCMHFPSIELIHPKTPLDRVRTSEFMRELIDNSSTIFEAMIAHLCAKHVLSFSGFPTTVLFVPEDRRRNKNVSYSYAIDLGQGFAFIG